MTGLRLITMITESCQSYRLGGFRDHENRGSGHA